MVQITHIVSNCQSQADADNMIVQITLSTAITTSRLIVLVENDIDFLVMLYITSYVITFHAVWYK